MSIFMQKTSIFLEIAKPRIIAELQRAKAERQLSDIAQNTGINNSRLTEFLNGKRELSLYYLAKFIQGRTMSIEQILQKTRIEDLPIEDQRFIFRIDGQDDETVNLLMEAKRQGVDYKTVLKAIVK